MNMDKGPQANKYTYFDFLPVFFAEMQEILTQYTTIYNDLSGIA